MTQTTHGLTNHAKSGHVSVGARLPVAGDAQHHQARVDFLQVFPTHTPALKGAGSKVFNQHIGFLDQLSRQVLPFRFTQIQCHRFFVARLHLPPHRRALLYQAPLPQRVAGAGRFNFDDVGAKVGQCFATKRASNELTHFYNPKPL